MGKSINLLEGKITPTLVKLAIPIMGTSLIQMGYNLVDMIWIGRLGSGAVAAVGAAGLFMIMAYGVTCIPKIGGQVSIAQSLGCDKKNSAVRYASASLQIGVFLGLIFGFICILFNRQMIDFFKLSGDSVIKNARIYLVIVCGLVIFQVLDQVIGSIFNAMGNTVITFKVTTIGLLINLVLDPMLIFGIGPFPRLEVAGAAIATVLAQVIVFIIYLNVAIKEEVIFRKIRILRKCSKESYFTIFRIGLPSAMHEVIFSSISMVIARLIAGYGDAAIAVQKVGGQIESMSWMMAGGFSVAINTFIAQNYGAGRLDRLEKGFKSAFIIMSVWGLFTSFLLMVFPGFFFRIFINEPDVIPMGIDYLRIIALSEIFMCMEGVATGAFQGLGKTVYPSICSVIFNLFRIPAAIFLSRTSLGLNGIWWALTISCVLKGTVIPLWYISIFRKVKKSMSKNVSLS
ncbi:MAG: MATE family efflux transporter [Eubacteriales bacterium]|nr:MATE family efflux transporter [Eubacteriales bacterium]